MTFFYIILFVVCSGFVFYLLTRVFIFYKISVLRKKCPKINSYLNDDSDEWLNWLIDNNENTVAAYLYRKKYRVTLSELHKKLEEIKKNRMYNDKNL